MYAFKIEIGQSTEARKASVEAHEKSMKNEEFKYPEGKTFSLFFYHPGKGVSIQYANLLSVEKLVKRMAKLGVKMEPCFYPSGTVEYHLILDKLPKRGAKNGSTFQA